MLDLTPPPTTPHPIGIYTEAARDYALASKSASTVRTYRSAFDRFEAWCIFSCDRAKALPATANTVALYLVSLAEAGRSFSTIDHARAAIGYAHRLAGHLDPTTAEYVRVIMAGIARRVGRAVVKKAPLTVADLRRVVAALPDSLTGKRDKALILIGWAGAFRRSELVGVDVAHTRLNGDAKITLARSKTDQEGAGFTKVIPPLEDKTLCPVTALRAWLEASQIQSGPLFRQVDRWGHIRPGALAGQTVARILKAAAKAVGIDPRQFGAHSLRSGFITAAAEAGQESRDIMAVSGHKSEAVMRGYIQDAGRGAKRAIKAAFGE
jgi:integrase